jgi:hypothetical protein
LTVRPTFVHQRTAAQDCGVSRSFLVYSQIAFFIKARNFVRFFSITGQIKLDGFRRFCGNIQRCLETTGALQDFD